MAVFNSKAAGKDKKMDLLHLHLLLNHVPVIGLILVTLLLAYALLKRSKEVQKLSLWAFVLLALVTIPVFLTGEPAEEVVENLPGVSKPVIESHERAALIAFIAIEVVGGAALILSLLSRRLGKMKWTGTLILALAVTASGLMGWAANLGGQVRHSEIRAGAGAPRQGTTDAGADKQAEAGEREDEKR